MSLESAVRAMLINGTTLATAGVPDSAVTHGYRPQSTALPAVTYELEQPEIIAIGDSLRRARCEVRIVAATTAAAINLIATIKALCVSGTYDSVVFQAVQWQEHTVEPAVTAEGDENEPAQVVCAIEIYY